MTTLEKQAEYWDSEWGNRTKTDKVEMNIGKMKVLLDELWKRPGFTLKEKLDIGCGTGVHAYILAQYSTYWKDRYMGIDLSKKAIKKAHSFGLNVALQDVYQLQNGVKKFQVFLLLDTLEHIEHHEKLGQKIRALGQEPYTIFGNIPLYLSAPHHEGAFERPMTIFDVARFLEQAGCAGQFWHRVYGAGGMPYMLFEGSSTGEIKGTIDESIAALPKME